MWDNKMKAVTFSFDDNVEQDISTIEILNRYGLKGTFNLNSGLLGRHDKLIRNSVEVEHYKNRAADIPHIYAGHEIAAHTVTHPLLTKLSDADVLREVEEDRLALSEIAGYEVVGFAYPGGGVNYNDRVADLIRSNTGVRYARTTVDADSFERQDDLIRFKPNAYYINADLFDTAERFIGMKADVPQHLYIWGHSYEMDAGYISWERFEELCAYLGGRDDVFYGTNAEVLLAD